MRSPYRIVVRPYVTLICVFVLSAHLIAACGRADTAATLGGAATDGPATIAPTVPAPTEMPTVLLPSPAPTEPLPSLETPAGSDQTIGAVFPELTTFSALRSLALQRDWSGLTRFSPYEAHYDLHPQADHIIGQARFSVAGSSGNPRTSETTIDIPADAITAFLRLLAATPLSEGAYTPLITHSDDYPKIGIQIETSSGTIEVFTASQGDQHIPWGLHIGEKMFVIDSDAPMQAIAALEPFLHQDMMQKLIDGA